MSGTTLKLLSADQLFEVRGAKCPKPLFEPKKNVEDHGGGGNPYDEAYLQEKYEELERVIGQQRVLLRGKSSVGRYQDDRIVLEKKSGCWDKFGVVEKGITYVPLYEALFLVETKRLLVFRENVIMSLEECYKMFLREDVKTINTDGVVIVDRLTLPEYLVYALMMRNQLVVRLHRSEQSPSPSVTEENLSVEEEQEMIWNHLQDLLGDRTRSTKSSTATDRIVEAMKSSCNIIASQSSSSVAAADAPDSVFVWPKRAPKRKQSNAWHAAPKRQKVQTDDKDLDKLKAEPEYQALRQIFERLEVIQLNPVTIEEDYKCQFEFRFDFLKVQQKSRQLSYRGIVCTRGSSPSYKDLVYLQRQQAKALPILVFNVDEAMVVNCFLYNVRG